MIYIYYIFLLVSYIIAVPFLIAASFFPRYRLSVPARFFLKNNPPFKNNAYWFHSCSLGETRSLLPIIRHFGSVNISVVTNTGFEEAKKYKNADVRFLPFEIFLPFWIKKCRYLVVMEAELWLMLFFIAKKRCQKTALINARISDKSYHKYLQFKFFYKLLFKYVDTVFAQSQKDAERLAALGAKNIAVAGNIKTAGEFTVSKHYINETKKPIIVAGSTHKNEETLILNAVDFKKFSLVIVPRHPERFNIVWSVIDSFSKTRNLSAKRFDGIIDKDIVLVDKMGELINFYAIADIVILGGAFGEFGGHNPIEVAYFNKPLISGKNIFNQKALFKENENYYIADNKYVLRELLLQNLKPSRIKNRGSIDKIIQELRNI